MAGRLFAFLRIHPANLRVPFTISLVIAALGVSLTGCGLVGGSGGWAPAMTVTPSTASFGKVTVKTHTTQTIKVSNSGTGELKISDATIAGAGFSMSGFTAPLKLAAGASVNFTVEFQPTKAETESGSVSIQSNASESPTTIALSGTGVTQSIKLSASATSLNFGNVGVGKAETQEVKLTNTGNANIAISNTSVSGTGFAASGSSNVELTPSQSVTVTVICNPKSSGSLKGTLTVSSNAGTVQIPLAGMATEASAHTVSLTWTASTSSVIGYFVYRRAGANGLFARLDSMIDPLTSFTDGDVANGATYFYVVTSVSPDDVESEFSTPVSVTIPSS